MSTTSLKEMSRQYRLETARLKVRIADLHEQKRKAKTAEESRALDNRLTALTAMFRDTREMSRYLEHYYDGEAGEYWPSELRRSKGGTRTCRQAQPVNLESG